MKTILIACLFASALFTNTSYAQSSEPELPWFELNSDDNYISYLNVETIKDLGGSIKQAWQMKNYSSSQKTLDGKTYHSEKIQYKYDCLNETIVIISYVSYGQKNGAGDVVTSHTLKSYEMEWQSVVPGTVGEGMFKFVCTR